MILLHTVYHHFLKVCNFSACSHLFPIILLGRSAWGTWCLIDIKVHIKILSCCVQWFEMFTSCMNVKPQSSGTSESTVRRDVILDHFIRKSNLNNKQWANINKDNVDVVVSFFEVITQAPFTRINTNKCKWRCILFGQGWTAERWWTD